LQLGINFTWHTFTNIQRNTLTSFNLTITRIFHKQQHYGNVTCTKHCNTTSPLTWNNSANSPTTTSRSPELLMRCHEFRYDSNLCINDLFQHEYRSPHLHLPLLGPLELLRFMWCKSIQHITTVKTMKHWLSAIVTGITLYHLMVICIYIPACNVQTTGFVSLMLLSNSLSLSPSTHN